LRKSGSTATALRAPPSRARCAKIACPAPRSTTRAPGGRKSSTRRKGHVRKRPSTWMRVAGGAFLYVRR